MKSDTTSKDGATRNTIAIIGASPDRSKFGNKAVRAFREKGWDVFPVHPTAATIEGLKAYRSVADLPERPRLVSLYVPSAVGLRVLKEIAGKGCDELWVNPGAESEALVEEAERLGLNVIQACSLVGHGLVVEEP